MTDELLRIALGTGLVVIGLVLVLNLGGFNDRQRRRNERREAQGAAIGWYAKTPGQFRVVGSLVLAIGAAIALMGLF